MTGDEGRKVHCGARMQCGHCNAASASQVLRIKHLESADIVRIKLHTDVMLLLANPA